MADRLLDITDDLLTKIEHGMSIQEARKELATARSGLADINQK